jgi:uncharacterized protein (DUF1778 family)
MAKRKLKGIRFGDEQWAWIEQAAEQAKVNTSQFVREAAFVSAAVTLLSADKGLAEAAEILRAAFRADADEAVMRLVVEELERQREVKSKH